MKQFSLDEYHKNPSKPLVTRSGLSVRIVCDDAPGDFPIIAIIYYTNTISLSFCQSCPHRFAFRFEQQLLGFLAVNLNWRSHELWNIVRHEPVVIECLRAFLWKHERLCHLSICRDMAEVRARELPVIAT